MKFIETMLLKIENEEWEIKNFKYHLWRVKWTLESKKLKVKKLARALEDGLGEKFFSKKTIKNHINKKLKNGKYRVRVIYSINGIENIEIFPIRKREFKKFKIVYSDIDYSFKYENRDKLNSLKVDGYDEVIIVKNGLITDTTISNLAFFNRQWHTPKTPLLKGSKREELINKGFLIPKDIKVENLKNYQKFAMINAIIGFYEIDINGIIL